MSLCHLKLWPSGRYSRQREQRPGTPRTPEPAHVPDDHPHHLDPLRDPRRRPDADAPRAGPPRPVRVAARAREGPCTFGVVPGARVESRAMLSGSVAFFERLAASPGTELFRVGGRIDPLLLRESEPLLVVDDGRRAHEYV